MPSTSFETAWTHPQLSTRGYVVLRNLVPPDAVQAALRHLHLDLVRRGAPADELGRWLWSAHWFPHLNWDPPIAGLAEWLPPELRDGQQCDPQIVLQPPDDCEEQELVPHVDQEPEWAAGRSFLRIVGVALTPASAANGGLQVWPLDGDERARSRPRRRGCGGHAPEAAALERAQPRGRDPVRRLPQVPRAARLLTGGSRALRRERHRPRRQGSNDEGG